MSSAIYQGYVNPHSLGRPILWAAWDSQSDLTVVVFQS